MFVGHGANVNTAESGGQRSIHVACAKNDLECVQLLLQTGCDVNVQGSTGQTPLMSAIAFSRNSDTCDLIIPALLEAGACILASDNQEHTALTYSLVYGMMRATEKLLSYPHPLSVVKQAIYFLALGNNRPLVAHMIQHQILGTETVANSLDLMGTSKLQ